MAICGKGLCDHQRNWFSMVIRGKEYLLASDQIGHYGHQWKEVYMVMKENRSLLSSEEMGL